MKDNNRIPMIWVAHDFTQTPKSFSKKMMVSEKRKRAAWKFFTYHGPPLGFSGLGLWIQKEIHGVWQEFRLVLDGFSLLKPACLIFSRVHQKVRKIDSTSSVGRKYTRWSTKGCCGQLRCISPTEISKRFRDQGHQLVLFGAAILNRKRPGSKP